MLKARLVQFIDDTLKAVSDTVFKLDADFDLLMVDDSVYIQRVTAFELLAEIDEQVHAAAVATPSIWESGSRFWALTASRRTWAPTSAPRAL
ncbi:MAG: Kiwa anti-phage protein KwaB-like domain-containing protein [Bryobacteraceae bacterium]